MKQPKIVTYMGALYDRFATEAKEVGDANVLVWQGKLIDTCISVGIPQGYYKKVVDTLRSIGCIEMITRGKRGSTPTTIALRYPPTLELYQEGIVKSSWDSLTRAPSSDTLGAQVRDIQSRLGGYDWLAMFKNLDDRVKSLETAVKDLQQHHQQEQQTQQ